MAEVAGLVVGSVTLTTLFNEGVETFKYIQAGRDFGVDYQKYLTKLGAVGLQFSRWGGAARRRPITISADEEEKAQNLLGNILNAFKHAKETSNSFKLKGKPSQFINISDPTVSPNNVYETALANIEELSTNYQKTTPFIAKVKWALYKKRDFKTLIDSVREDVNDLVTLFPAVIPLQRELAGTEVSQIEQPQTLRVLAEISSEEDGDKIMDMAVKKEIEERFGMSWEKIDADAKGYMMVGPDYGEEAAISALQSDKRPSLRFHDIKTKSGQSTHIGPSYAGNFSKSHKGMIEGDDDK